MQGWICNAHYSSTGHDMVEITNKLFSDFPTRVMRLQLKDLEEKKIMIMKYVHM